MQAFVAELVARAPLSPRVLVLTFDADRPLLRQAGQYVELLPEPDVAHAFSIASALDAARPERFEIAAVIDSSAPFVLELPLGARLGARGPLGALTWQGAAPSLFVATGTGISPLRALLHEELARASGASLCLLFGCRDAAEELWGAELRELAVRHTRFRYWPTCSRPQPGYAGRSGRVQAHLAEAVAWLGPGLHAYLCGHTAMVRDCGQALLALGVEPGALHGESY